MDILSGILTLKTNLTSSRARLVITFPKTISGISTTLNEIPTILASSPSPDQILILAKLYDAIFLETPLIIYQTSKGFSFIFVKDISNVVSETELKVPCSFRVVENRGKSFLFAAERSEDYILWFEKISEAVHVYTYNRERKTNSKSVSSNSSSSISRRGIKEENNISNIKIVTISEKTEKKLSVDYIKIGDGSISTILPPRKGFVNSLKSKFSMYFDHANTFDSVPHQSIIPHRSSSMLRKVPKNTTCKTPRSQKEKQTIKYTETYKTPDQQDQQHQQQQQKPIPITKKEKRLSLDDRPTPPPRRGPFRRNSDTQLANRIRNFEIINKSNNNDEDLIQEFGQDSMTTHPDLSFALVNVDVDGGELLGDGLGLPFFQDPECSFIDGFGRACFEDLEK